MKTHELARALEQLADILRMGPNVPLADATMGDIRPNKFQSTDALAVNLNTLSALSRVDRRQWLALIEEHQFPIEIRPRDASRDILGKLLRFLEVNPTAREQLRRRTSTSSRSASPELLHALQTLLREQSVPTPQTEIQNNYRAFSSEWWSGLTASRAGLDPQDPIFSESYGRLVSLNAWRTPLLESQSPVDALAFFVEAQNDAILSHVQARLACWRLALQCLRSVLENVLYFLYYKDHPIELRMWSEGHHRLGAQELFTYVAEHPDIHGLDLNLIGFSTLKDEYSTLSKAVHASAAGFRMTAAGTLPALTVPDVPRLGMWATREKLLLSAINVLLLAFYRQHLTGAAHPALRVSIASVVPSKRHALLGKALGVAIRA